MIAHFIEKFEKNKETLKEKYALGHPSGYEQIVADVVEILGQEDGSRYDLPDPKRITEINDGDYQGTSVFIIGAQGYQRLGMVLVLAATPCKVYDMRVDIAMMCQTTNRLMII